MLYFRDQKLRTGAISNKEYNYSLFVLQLINCIYLQKDLKFPLFSNKIWKVRIRFISDTPFCRISNDNSQHKK